MLRSYTKIKTMNEDDRIDHLKKRQFKAYRKHYIKKRDARYELVYKLNCLDVFLELIKEDEELDEDDPKKMKDDDIEYYQTLIDWLYVELDV